MGNQRTPRYPHVDQVTDVPTQNSLRLAWDQLRNQNDIVTATNDTIASLLARIETLESAAAASVGITTTTRVAIATGTDSGGGGDSGGGTDDGGQGAAGCADAGANGHVPTGTPLNLKTAGMVVCGTGNEFAALKAPVVDQPTRDANVLELLGRMIYHLQLAGFAAGKQRNPSGLVSTDKLTVQQGTTWWAYDVFSLVPFDQPLNTQMIPVGGANTVADGGIPD